MHLILSTVSGRGLWILWDLSHGLVGESTWSESDGSDMASRLGSQLEELLHSTRTDRTQIESIHCVSGPGAFTGLRIGSSFCQGLARALGKAVYGIPTIELFEKTFYLPLRQQKAKLSNLHDYLAAGFEFLKVTEKDSEIAIPHDGAIVLGFDEYREWPSSSQLASAAARSLASKRPLHIVYGIEPKISGQRQIPS